MEYDITYGHNEYSEFSRSEDRTARRLADLTHTAYHYLRDAMELNDDYDLPFGITNADILQLASQHALRALEDPHTLQIELTDSTIRDLCSSFGHELSLSLKHVMGLNPNGHPSQGDWLTGSIDITDG